MNAMAELSVSEASQILGLSAATVKRRLISGELTGKKETRPQGTRWLVEVDTNHVKVNPPLTDSSRTQVTHSSELTTLVTMLQEELEARRREISELHQLLAQQTALNAARRPWWKLW